jgi:hypothetical protein
MKGASSRLWFRKLISITCLVSSFSTFAVKFLFPALQSRRSSCLRPEASVPQRLTPWLVDNFTYVQKLHLHRRQLHRYVFDKPRHLQQRQQPLAQVFHNDLVNRLSFIWINRVPYNPAIICLGWLDFWCRHLYTAWFRNIFESSQILWKLHDHLDGLSVGTKFNFQTSFDSATRSAAASFVIWLDWTATYHFWCTISPGIGTNPNTIPWTASSSSMSCHTGSIS